MKTSHLNSTPSKIPTCLKISLHLSELRFLSWAYSSVVCRSLSSSVSSISAKSNTSNLGNRSFVIAWSIGARSLASVYQPSMAVIEIRRWRSARSSRVGMEMRSLARLGISCSVGSPLVWEMCRPMSMSVEFKGEVKISERPAKLAENPTMFRSQSVCRDERQRTAWLTCPIKLLDLLRRRCHLFEEAGRQIMGLDVY